MELASISSDSHNRILGDDESFNDSLRSSLDDAYYENHQCKLQIVDKASEDSVDPQVQRFEMTSQQQSNEALDSLRVHAILYMVRLAEIDLLRGTEVRIRGGCKPASSKFV